jgi:hypothetical protein
MSISFDPSKSNATDSSFSGQSSSLHTASTSSISSVAAATAAVSISGLASSGAAIAATAFPTPQPTAVPVPIASASSSNRAQDQKAPPPKKPSALAASDVKPASGPAEIRTNTNKELTGRATPANKAAITQTILYWAKGVPTGFNILHLSALKAGFINVHPFQILLHIAQEKLLWEPMIQLKGLEIEFATWRDEMVQISRKFHLNYPDHAKEFLDGVEAIFHPDADLLKSLKTNTNTRTPNKIVDDFVWCIEAHLLKETPAAPTKK